MQTVNLCRHFIGSTSWTTPAELLFLLRGVGDEIRAVYTEDPAVVNMVRRILAAVREETARQHDNDASRPKDEVSSLLLWTLPQNVSSRHHPVAQSSSERHESVGGENELVTSDTLSYPESYYARHPQLKEIILEAVHEIYNELVDMRDAVAEQVPQQIHSGDVILVCGRGLTLARFLAATAPSTTLLVCGSPSLANHLQHKDINCPATVIPIALAQAVAVASRVHTTVISAHAVLANGGVVSTAGSALVVAATPTPTLCVTGMDALCPQYPHEGQDTLQEWMAPTMGKDVQPMYDYIPPEQINLFVTNAGSFPPSFIYRLLAENYHSDDWKLFR